MLSKRKFQCLNDIFKNEKISCTKNNFDEDILEDLRKDGLIENLSLTEKGKNTLEEFKVDNAIIMAAGLSSRFAPLSYERPKALLEVKGEILIERQIRQLKEAGIDNITIVVGYMKEKFYYLKDKFNVDIVVNEEYKVRNNNSTLYLVRDRLKNSYICSSDNYFVDNVFEKYVYDSYYSSVFEENETDEYCITVDDDNTISYVTVGGENAWIMLGHVYFSKEFSKRFTDILVKEYDEPGVDSMLWEDIFIRHLGELRMNKREYKKGEILEFDSLDDLRDFDESYKYDSRSQVIKNICSILKCKEADVKNIVPIKKGLTNISFKFLVDGKAYVYRLPGVGTEEIINRESEAFSQGVAKELGLDNTYIYMSPTEGWKICEFIDNCIDFDYRNTQDVEKAMKMVKKLHDACVPSKWEFSIFDEADKLLTLAKQYDYINNFKDIEEITEMISRLYKFTESDNVPKRLCHNDCYDPNFLTDGENMYLIDWEYSGNADPASDIGTFICCSDYTLDEAKDVLKIYFGRELTEKEMRHYLGYVAISSYYWFVWAVFKESLGEDIGDYVKIWHDYAVEYGNIALALYENK